MGGLLLIALKVKANPSQLLLWIGLNFVITVLGLTLIPLRIYFKGPRAKVELALARGKEGRDRRRDIADRDVRREVEREFKSRMR